MVELKDQKRAIMYSDMLNEQPLETLLEEEVGSMYVHTPR